MSIEHLVEIAKTEREGQRERNALKAIHKALNDIERQRRTIDGIEKALVKETNKMAVMGLAYDKLIEKSFEDFDDTIEEEELP